jgi:hypothetical protein
VTLLYSIEGMRQFSSRTVRQFGVSITSKAHFHAARSQNWNSKTIASRMKALAASEAAEMDQKPDYTAWSHERLIKRVAQLEKELRSMNQRSIHSNIPRDLCLCRKQPVNSYPCEENMEEGPHRRSIRPSEVHYPLGGV